MADHSRDQDRQASLPLQHSEATQEVIDSLIDLSGLFSKDHMGAPVDNYLPGSPDLIGEVFGVFRWGHCVLAATESQGRQPDVMNPIHDVELVAAEHIVEENGRAILQGPLLKRLHEFGVDRPP